MAFPKTHYTAEHDQPAVTELEGEIREFVNRDVVALQSTKAIAESLTQWRKVPGADTVQLTARVSYC